MTLTSKTVRDAKPAAKTYILWDKTTKGLGLKVTPAGAKSFVLSYRHDGRKRQMVVGRASETTIGDVRAAAAAHLVDIRNGGDPLREKSDRKLGLRVRDGVRRYTEEHIPKRIQHGQMTERTRREYARQLSTYILPAIGDLVIADVTRKDVEKLVGDLKPVTRNRVLALLSSLFNLFESWELRSQNTNPTRGVEKSREEARDRIFSKTEMSQIGAALDSYGTPHAVLAIRLAALTGLRISEVLRLRWEDIDTAASTATLVTTKSGRRVHTLPAAATALLAGTPRVGAFVVMSSSDTRPADDSAQSVSR